ncbi:regulator of chromosome condensation [Anaeramoeba flamelloides]|uniref:Regulator of chromosome condensation n=1 Tax=Anaeramoeba flamelloides TaxID=1746091 RepID=A0AAV7YYD6_9EUKA|nr:regulator of chromosome condensation [Anaeramoeba flamelloides]
MNNQIYFSGKKDLYQHLSSDPSLLPHWCEINYIFKPPKIKKLIANKIGFLFLKNNNQIEFFQKNHKKNTFNTFLFDEEVVDIVCGTRSFLILTESGKVFSLAGFKTTNYQWKNIAIPLSDPENSSFREIRLVSFFTENNLFVKSIVMARQTNFFLCKDGKLYGSGENKSGQFGKGTFYGEQTPILICENIRKIFNGGSNANSLFFITTNDELFACGASNSGKLGVEINDVGKHLKVTTIIKETTVNKSDENKKARSSKDFDQNNNQKKKLFGNFFSRNKKIKLNTIQILDIKNGYYHSILLTKDREVYSCGNGIFNGIGEDKRLFTLIPSLQEKKFIQISCSLQTLLLSEENELYGWGFYEYNEPNKPIKGWDYPQKIKLPTNFNITSSLKLYCAEDLTLIYNSYQKSCIELDFFNIFKTKSFSDSKIKYHSFASQNKKKKKIIKRKRNENTTRNNNNNTNMDINMNMNMNENQDNMNRDIDIDRNMNMKNKKFEKTNESTENENEIAVHKILIELRTNLKINEIQKIVLKNCFTKMEIINFLKWVYLDQINDEILLQKFFNSLDLSFPPQNKLEQDLENLYNDEDSKDFLILIHRNKKEYKENKRKRKKGNNNKQKKINKKISNSNKNTNTNTNSNSDSNTNKKINTNTNKNTNTNINKNTNANIKSVNNLKGGGNDLGDDEEEEKKKKKQKEKEKKRKNKYLEIKVHKFILFTRSGLFRALFEFTENNIPTQIKDYSEKSFKSLQILIKFLYTGKIQLDNEGYENLHLILEELKDAIEYFQLNEKSSLINQFKNSIEKN